MIDARHLTKRSGKAVAADDASFVAQPVATGLPGAIGLI
jgi:hypothetical protein